MTAEEAKLARATLDRYDRIVKEKQSLSSTVEHGVGLSATGDLRNRLMEMLQIGLAVKVAEFDKELAALQINTTPASDAVVDPGPRRVIT